MLHEQEDISAEQNSQETYARVSGPVQNQERAGRVAPPSGEGSPTFGGLGFSPAHRLRTQKEFAACFEAGRRYHGKIFLLFVLPRPQRDACWRLGLAIGKKVGNAVIRNRVKRVLRESLRLCAPAAVSGLDIVVVAKKNLDPGVLDLPLACRDLCPLLERMAKDFDRFGRPGNRTACVASSSGPYDSIGSPSHP